MENEQQAPAKKRLVIKRKPVAKKEVKIVAKENESESVAVAVAEAEAGIMA